ncbi:MAG: DUF4197 domain-containing protein [Alphaproteobacteria bacterium]|jgi:hypothetical protein|nr:DUF4197 domain-containing protein [Alphaproteobacteria bacterium]MCK5621684.1 DUF4197 domain-containing protein [Alphaproteobacteria bacterium]
MIGRRSFVALLSGAALSGCQTTIGSGGLSLASPILGGGGSRPLTDLEIGNGLKEALRIGTQRVVGQVGAVDGYNADPLIHIPLPEDLRKVHNVLDKVGLASMTADLELKLNRSAERAAPEAKEVFWNAITEMSLDDVRGIWQGPDDAATQYFRGKMTLPLTDRFTPIVLDTMGEVGAIRSYDRMMSKYESIPFVPDVKADLTRYTVKKALSGLFTYVAKEEAAIRKDPAKRTTELLQRVFGALTS